jgi:hypothetical protein
MSGVVAHNASSEPQEAEPLVNGDVKPGKTPVVSINSLTAEREGAISPRTYSLVSVAVLVTFLDKRTMAISFEGALSGIVE